MRLFSSPSASIFFVLPSTFFCVSNSSRLTSSYMSLYVSCTLLAVSALRALRLANHAMAAPMPPEGIAHWIICKIVSAILPFFLVDEFTG